MLGNLDFVKANETLFGINQLINISSGAIFGFLPLAVAYSACKRFGGRPILGIVMGCIMLSNSLADAYAAAQGTVEVTTLHIFGLGVDLVGFQGGIIVALLMGFVTAKLDIFFEKKVPEVIRLLLSPLLTTLVGAILLFTIIGPEGRGLSSGITNALVWMTQNLGVFGYAVFSGLQQLVVITGLHHIFGAIEAQLLADTGRNFINPLMSVAIIAQGGAVLAYLAMHRKNVKVRELCIPSFISVLFGITEPALFGINLRYRFPIIGGCIGGALGGIVVYFTNLAALGFGTTVVPGIALADPTSNGYINYIVAHAAAITGGFVMTLVLGRFMDQAPVEAVATDTKKDTVNEGAETEGIGAQECDSEELEVPEEKSFFGYAKGQQIPMEEDDDYLDSIHSIIRTERVNAEYAVAVTGDNFSEMFAAMDDDYMKARAADVKDISNRLIRILEGRGETNLPAVEPAVIVADDLSPSETVQMDKEKILAFVTVHGSTNSHTAILARMMNIPALIGVSLDLDEIHTGMMAVVDGFEGTVTFEPDEELCKLARQKMEEEQEKLRLLDELKGKENVTLDGRKINLYANIGSVSDVGYVLENDAGGIGLFRSEFLYLGRDSFPTEEEQFQAYRQVAQTMAGKKVIIRTLDIGADKQADYFSLGQEENPAMGYRAIRICLKQPDIFKTQLRALFRATMYGNISIMYPMITSVEEVEKIFEIVKEVREELDTAEIPYHDPEQGIMIETPAAVMLSDELAELADFFSIGTNDLTQYTLAVDRQNEKLDDFYNPHHKAILRMIQMVVVNAHKHEKWAGICGELGADLELTEEFVRMGLDELSVAPSMILKLRKKIREMTVL